MRAMARHTSQLLWYAAGLQAGRSTGARETASLACRYRRLFILFSQFTYMNRLLVVTPDPCSALRSLQYEGEEL